MLASLHSGSSKKVWPELLRVAEKQQGPLFIFPGGRIACRDEYEYMRNGIFKLVNSSGFDAVLCWASSLSGYVPEKQVETFLLSDIDLPLVTFGLKVGDRPVVHIDAYSGMKQLVRHLARKHGRKRIAFIGGPREHSSSVDRHRAYRDTLLEEGIGIDPGIECLDNAWDEGRKAALKLLDSNGMQPGKDFDALCGASDLLVFEASKLLQERGYKIPSDVAIGGFNDSEESDIFPPTCTTVKMPFEREALQAFHMLLEMLDGGSPGDRTLKTKLVIRQSCGCRTERVQRAGIVETTKWKRRVGSEVSGETVLDFVAATAGLGHEDRPPYLESIALAFMEASTGHGTSEFLDALDRSLNECIFAEKEIDIFQDLLSAFRTAGAGLTGFKRDRQKLEAMIGQGRVLVSEAEKRTRNYRAWKERSLDHWLNNLGQELLWAKSCDSILEAASRCLPNLGIGKAYLVLNSAADGEHFFAGGFESSAGNLRMLRYPEDPRTARFPATRLLPEALMPSGRGVYIVLPLFTESTSLGYFVVQASRSDAYIYEEIRAQISSAFRGVRLFEEADAARALAEKAEKLKTEFLAGISAELQAPVDFIQRLAGEMLKDPHNATRANIERIQTSAARQKEFTQMLLDLSLAQVDDINLAEDLIDPADLMNSFIAQRSPQNIFMAALTQEDSTDLPLVRGDRRRLLQVLGIFADMFGEKLHPNGIRARIGFDSECVSLGLGSEANENAAESRSIGMELAMRVAFLHGGRVSQTSSEGLKELVLHLPYPCLSEMRSASLGEGDFEIAVMTGAAPGRLTRAGFPIHEVNLSYFAAAGRPGAAPVPKLICLDLDCAPDNMLPALEVALERSEFRRAGWFLKGGRARANNQSSRSGLRDILLSLIPEREDSIVISLDPGSNQVIMPKFHVRVASIEDLSVAAERYRPRVVAISSMDSSVLTTTLANPDLSDSTLFWAADRLLDAQEEALLCARPRSIAFNTGTLFKEALGNAINRVAGGEEPLPAATGALIVKSVFFLNRHFRESITRWRLSDSVNASEDYLSRIFRKQMGISLWDYLSRLRIGYSLELLRATGESVNEIASKAGFQDQAYFCRVFRRVTGMTPGQARKTP